MLRAYQADTTQNLKQNRTAGTHPPVTQRQAAGDGDGPATQREAAPACVVFPLGAFLEWEAKRSGFRRYSRQGEGREGR